MKTTIPTWAMITATPADWPVAQKAHARRQMQIQWPDHKQVRTWAKHQRWPTPIFGFEDAFVAMLLKTDENFSLGLTSGIVLHLPRASYPISAEKLAELDALYAERSPTGRPSEWGSLVEELREIRRAVEAGVIVTVEGVTVEGVTVEGVTVEGVTVEGVTVEGVTVEGVTVEGVTVEDNLNLNSFAAFYSWAHGRYHMLEDGYDRWIGDDG
ncbi:hypothetical protein GC175_07855 [bacterium]|nr:hypothetical protein [bacterium]